MENRYAKKVYSGLVLLLILGAFLLGYLTFYFHHKSMSEKPVSQVPLSNSLVLNAEPVKTQDIEFINEYVGYVTPVHEANIQPYINGYIDKIMVDGGDIVKQGDVLLVLDQSEYKAALDAAYANVIKANANFNNAQTYFERTKKAKSAVSQTEFDKAQADFLSAKAGVAEAIANFDQAKVNFNYTFLTSPINGIVGNVSLTKGNYVSPTNGSLFSIVQLSPIRVMFSITDKEYLNKLKKKSLFENEEILLKLSDNETFPNKGVFKYSDNSVNKNSGNVNIYVDFENLGKTLLPNAYVTIMVKQTFKQAIKILKDYVWLEENGSFVYVIRNGKIEKIEIDILADGNTFFIAENTLLPTDLLIMQNVNPADIGKNATTKNKDTK